MKKIISELQAIQDKIQSTKNTDRLSLLLEMAIKEAESLNVAPEEKPVNYTVWTDGACSGNPGPGGFGIVIKLPNGKKEKYSRGFFRTTNNRMELRAVLFALELISMRETNSAVITIISDSKYVTDAFNKGWFENWKKMNFANVKNPDLWAQMMPLIEHFDVRFEWIKGHSGHPENEVCDSLAVAASKSPTDKD